MGDAIISRRGGVTTEQALAPTITEVSTTQTSITFTITNNDASTAVILYEVGDTTPDANSIELAAAATSGNLTVTGLSVGEHDVYATANVAGKVKSNVTELTIEIEPIVYTAATGGTTLEYDDGGTRYKSHTFTTDGTFTVTTVGNATDDLNKVDYLIIAGGGAGGGNGGGAGAGGYRTTNGTSGRNSLAESKFTLTAQSYSIIVGAGGVGGTYNTRSSRTNGVNSSAFSIISIGGARGGNEDLQQDNGIGTGNNGGSGSGGGYANKIGGFGIAGQGFDGAASFNVNNYGGGGGAGASASGMNGGNGLFNTLRTGSAETRAGGGGGGLQQSSGTAGIGGTGGGGNGNRMDLTAGSGTVNTGSGGGGSAGGSGISGSGGSGIVVIRYEIAPSV